MNKSAAEAMVRDTWRTLRGQILSALGEGDGLTEHAESAIRRVFALALYDVARTPMQDADKIARAALALTRADYSLARSVSLAEADAETKGQTR